MLLAASERLLIRGLLLIRIRVWSPCSLHSARLIMPRNVPLSPPLITPTEAGKWGAGVNLGQIPKESSTPNNTPTQQNSSPITPHNPPTADHHTRTKPRTQIPLSRAKWKAAVVIYCSINASWGRPMRRPVPLFARGPWDNSEFSALKQLLKENSAAFPGENRSSLKPVCFLQFDQD